MIKLLSLFSGIGAFEKALTNIGEPYEIVNYCEIDKYASKAYSLIHNLDENMNLKDVTTVETEKLPHDIDFITYGFPCQDISQAGKQKGFTNENGDLTRSGLFFEALRIIEETQPKIAIAENVKALTGKRFTAEFKIVLDSLNDAGYTNYWAVLNAKDYGVPQNRERVFIISIRNDINHGFNFPKKYELKLRLKDLLETDVDEKYYLSDEMLSYLIKNNAQQKKAGNGFKFAPTDGNGIATAISTKAGGRMTDNFICVKNGTKKGYTEAHAGDYVNLQFPGSDTLRGRVGVGVSQTLCCNDGNGVVVDDKADIKQVGQMYPNSGNPQAGRIYDCNGISPSLDTCSGGNRMPKIVCCAASRGRGENNAQQLEFRFDECTNSLTTVQKDNLIVEERLTKQAIETLTENECDDGDTINPFNKTVNKSGVCPTITTRPEGFKTAILPVTNNLRIRKLTPKECFRLMGFSDCDIDILIDNGISNTQLYKMAGNSIVVDVLEEIFVELLNQYENVFPVGG